MEIPSQMGFKWVRPPKGRPLGTPCSHAESCTLPPQPGTGAMALVPKGAEEMSSQKAHLPNKCLFLDLVTILPSPHEGCGRHIHQTSAGPFPVAQMDHSEDQGRNLQNPHAPQHLHSRVVGAVLSSKQQPLTEDLSSGLYLPSRPLVLLLRSALPLLICRFNML